MRCVLVLSHHALVLLVLSMDLISLATLSSAPKYIAEEVLHRERDEFPRSRLYEEAYSPKDNARRIGDVSLQNEERIKFTGSVHKNERGDETIHAYGVKRLGGSPLTG
jgi:hypothetical protein